MTRKLLTFVLALAGAVPCHSEGPTFRHKDGRVDQEFEQVYQDLRGTQKSLPVRTKAQLQGMIPPATNLLYICSDCSVTGLVISTATTISSFGSATSKTTAIN